MLSRPSGRPGLHQLGTRRHHHDARTRRRGHPAEAQGREQPDLAGADHLAPAHQEVALAGPPRRRSGCAGPPRAPGARAPRARSPRSTRTAPRRCIPRAPGAPVMMRTAVPGVSVKIGRLAGRDLAHDRQVHRAAPRWRRRRRGTRRRTRPCRSCRRPAATPGACTSSATGSPIASISGCSNGWHRLDAAQHALEIVLDGQRPAGASRRGMTRPYSEASPSPRTAPDSTRPCSPSSLAEPLHLDALAEGPVAGDDQRLGLLQRRHPGREALVELLDHLVVLVVEVDERELLGHLVEDEVACRGRRRPSAAPAGRWSSSPARSGRGRPRSCASPGTPRWQRPSPSRPGSPRGSSSRAGSTFFSLRINGRPRMPSRRVSSCAHALEVEPEVVRGGVLVPLEVAERVLVGLLRSARSRAGRSGRRPCGGRSGHPCGRQGYDARPRSRTAHPTGRTSRRPGRPGRRRGCRSWRRTRSGSRRRSACRAGRSPISAV